MGKLINITQLQNFATGFATKNDARFIKKTALEIVKDATAQEGYFASYSLMLDGETQLGEKINIPKDYVVSAAEIKTCTVADTPIQGLNVGDKYIDLTINVKAGSSDVSHLYIAVKDLVDAYNAGNGITIDGSNNISVQIDSSNANGLSVGANGLALAPATSSTAGAMSAADKAKLDDLLNAYTGSAPIEVDANTGVISILPATAPDLDQSIVGNAGSMSAADKAKLDSFVEATQAEVQAVIDSLYTTA